MNIRELFNRSSEEMLKQIFNLLPPEIDSFCVSCGGMGLFTFPYNNFDKTLDYRLYEKEIGEIRSKAKKTLNRYDNFIHLLFLRWEHGLSISFDSKNEGIENIVAPNAILLPHRVTLTSIGVIAKEFPIIGYELNEGLDLSDPKKGFVIYRSADHFDLAIRKGVGRGFTAIRYNYQIEWVRALKKETVQ